MLLCTDMEQEDTTHTSLFAFMKEKQERRKNGFAILCKSVVKQSYHNTVIRVTWGKEIMNKSQFVEMKLEVGEKVAEEFARDAGVCEAQIDLWNTHQQTIPKSHPQPRDYSYLMQRN